MRASGRDSRSAGVSSVARVSVGLAFGLGVRAGVVVEEEGCFGRGRGVLGPGLEDDGRKEGGAGRGREGVWCENYCQYL